MGGRRNVAVGVLCQPAAGRGRAWAIFSPAEAFLTKGAESWRGRPLTGKDVLESGDACSLPQRGVPIANTSRWLKTDSSLIRNVMQNGDRNARENVPCGGVPCFVTSDSG
jgi:hypothetical protein